MGYMAILWDILITDIRLAFSFLWNLPSDDYLSNWIFFKVLCRGEYHWVNKVQREDIE